MFRFAIVVSLMGALALGCTSSDSKPPASPIQGTASVATQVASSVGFLQPAIRSILSRNVDDSIALVSFTPVGCVKEQTVGAPPPCEEGEQEGTLKPAFLSVPCEGVYLTSKTEVREVISRALSRDPQIALYAVVRAGDTYLVATNYGQQASPTQLGLIWTVNRAGSIVELRSVCANYIAKSLQNVAPSGTFILGPLASCSPPPGKEVELVVQIEGPRGGLESGSVAGAASAVGSNTISERAVVEIPPGTQWSGPLRFRDLRPGMKLRVTGVRLQDCAIRADRIEVIN